MKSTNALFFHGKSPVPEKGRLAVEDRGLVFSGEEKEMVVPWSWIRNQAMHGEDLEIRFAPRRKAAHQAFEVAGGMAFHRDLLRARLPHVGKLKSLSLHFQLRPIRSALGFVLVAIPACLLLYYGLLFQSYRLMPRSFDAFLGDQYVKKFQPLNRSLENEHWEKLSKALLARLKPDPRLAWHLNLVENPVPNAYALPNGEILVHTGLVSLADSPEELAAVLSHEIAHVEKRHGLRQIIRLLGVSFIFRTMLGPLGDNADTLNTITDVATLGVFLRYSRSFENEADREGLLRLERSRTSAEGFRIFFEKMKGYTKERKEPKTGFWAKIKQVLRGGQRYTEWISTHPLLDKRIEGVKAFQKSHPYTAAGFSSEKEMLRALKASLQGSSRNLP